MNDNEKQNAIEVLNKILELELAGVVRYTHYALMVFGYNRIPIVSWLKGNGDESLMHAHKAGELAAPERRCHESCRWGYRHLSRHRSPRGTRASAWVQSWVEIHPPPHKRAPDDPAHPTYRFGRYPTTASRRWPLWYRTRGWNGPRNYRCANWLYRHGAQPAVDDRTISADWCECVPTRIIARRRAKRWLS